MNVSCTVTAQLREIERWGWGKVHMNMITVRPVDGRNIFRPILAHQRIDIECRSRNIYHIMTANTRH